MGTILNKKSLDTGEISGDPDGFFETLLRNIPLPVCLINGSHQILFSNPAFQFLREKAPQLSRDLSFSILDKKTQNSFMTASNRMFRGQSSSETVFIAGAKTHESLWATLTPSGDAGTILITILTPGLMREKRETMEQRLRTLFGLTRTEARCALLLARGMSAGTIAQQRGVSLPTVRTQLLAIRAKMCVTSSLAVAAQISKLAMPFGSAERQL
jgi:DNA-binding CsgD family transcriptional regulator